MGKLAVIGILTLFIFYIVAGHTVTDKPNGDNDTDNDTDTDSENGDDVTSEQIEGVQPTQSNNGVPPTQSYNGAPTTQSYNGAPPTISNNGVPTTISNNGVPPTSAYLYSHLVQSNKVVPSGRMFKLYK